MLLLLGPLGMFAHPALATADDLTALSIEELASIEVTSVSKRPEPELTAPAAVTVITQDDIRRSGATSIPEALRLVPGVEVARIDGSKWAIGVRGFGSRLARSLLVLIDGRSVYNPLFAGTYWEVQDVLLEDVDRIEVIRGPGGTLWGANAFNGVINVITKSARETQGALVTAGGGTEERAFAAARYGGSVGERFHYRAYAKAGLRDGGVPRMSPGYQDDWRMGQVGARADWQVRDADRLTLQGDLYAAQVGTRVDAATFDPPGSVVLMDRSPASGGNVLTRWEHRISDTSDTKLQLYYDRTKRLDPHFHERRDTVDVDFDHRMALPWRQELVWGLGYRLTAGRTAAIPTISFNPANRTDNLWSGFVQDEISLIENRLRVTVGTKVEHNDYSGIEVQPSARVALLATQRQTVWASVARAVRTPSATEHDLQLNIPIDPSTATFFRILGNRRFISETVYASELGYRLAATRALSFSASGFFNEYRDLLSIETGTPFQEMGATGTRTVIPGQLSNGLRGRTMGGEAQVDWLATRWLNLRASYSYLRLRLEPRAGSNDARTAGATEGSSPAHQASFRMGLQPVDRMEIDGIFRFVSALPAQSVEAYANLDVRVAWRALPGLDLAVVAQNLLQARRTEYAGTSPTAMQVQRGIYGKVTWRW